MIKKHPGNLFVVATPIGNLGDISFRAVDTLKNSDFIICEDTRETGKLLRAYEIKREMVVLNAGNEEKRIGIVLDKINSGYSASLVSDAGTPCISDPGTRLINAAIAQDIFVSGIPGANAAALALSISGLPADSFVFEGFLPQKKGRQKKLKELAEEKRTIVLYESVHRIEKLLNELSEYMPSRLTLVFRELTKKFEEMWQGIPEEILASLPEKKIKGEFVVVLSPLGWKQNY